MKLRSEKNRDGVEEQDTEAGAAYVTPTDPFEEEEQTLIRPDHHHHEDPEEPGEELKPEETEETQETLERSEVGVREDFLFKVTSKSETKISSRRKEQSSLEQEFDDVRHKSEGKATNFKSEKKLQDDVR